MDSIRHFFGFKEDPFPQDIPVKKLFPLPGFPPLEKRVAFAISIRGITIITGEVGSGKSTSLRYVCDTLHPGKYHIISLIGGSYGLVEFLRHILLSFGVSYHSYQVSVMMQMVRSHVLEIAGRNEIPVMIVDEAHLLKQNLFSQLHTLLQFEFDSKPIMPVILCGQDSLLDLLMSPIVRPLASRILGRSHLEALKSEVMTQYINHHMQLAGAKEVHFMENAVMAIHQGSGGLLRRANALAKGALLAAAMEKNKTVSADHVRLASTEII